MTIPIRIQVFREQEDPSLFGLGTKVVAESAADVCVASRATVAGLQWPYESLSATHAPTSKGIYEEIYDPVGEGEWLLLVRCGFDVSPVAQRLTVFERDGALRAHAGWGSAAKLAQLRELAATVHITNIDHRKGRAPSQTPRSTIVQVVLRPRREAVIMNGREYSDRRLPLDKLALHRRDFLFTSGKIDAGAIVTHLDAEHRRRTVYVKSQSPRKSDWVAVGEEQPHPLQQGEDRPAGAKELGILDLYRHIDGVGKHHPKTIVDVSIISHGVLGGPVLHNTYDIEPSFARRYAQDLDGRTKDYLPSEGEIATAHPSFAAAFHADAAFRVFGCIHIGRLMVAMRTALDLLNAGAGRNVVFSFSFGDHEEGKLGLEFTTLEHLRRELVEYCRGHRINRHQEPKTGGERVAAYAGMAAQRNFARVFSAAPGMGADVGVRLGTFTMHIETEVWTEDRPPENQAGVAYLKQEFGEVVQFDEFNYLDYSAFLHAAPGDPGWHTERCRITGTELVTMMRLPSGIEIMVPMAAAFEPPVPFALGARSGHLYASRVSLAFVSCVREGAILSVFLAAEPGERVGFFVAKNGETTVVRPFGDGWSVTTEVISIEDSTFGGGLNWEPNGNVVLVTDGVLERVEPRWYW